MRIINTERMANCFESEFVYKYFFDTGWTEEAILSMEALGHLRYYADFPRPMFQVQCPDGTIVKGVQSASECRVIFSRDGPDAAKKRFENRFEGISLKGG